MFAKSTRLSLVEGWGAGLEDCTCPLHCTLEYISGSLCSAEHCLKILVLVDFFAYSRSPGGLRLWIEAHFHTWLRVGRVSRHSDSWHLSIPFYMPFMQRNRVHFLLNHFFFGFTALLILEQQRTIKIHARAKIKLLFSVTWLTCPLGWPYPAFQSSRKQTLATWAARAITVWFSGCGEAEWNVRHSYVLFPIQSCPNFRVWGASLDVLVGVTFSDNLETQEA